MSDVCVILQKPKGIQHEMYEIKTIATVYLAKTETILPANRDIDEDIAKYRWSHYDSLRNGSFTAGR